MGPMAGDVVVGVNGRAITKGSDLIGAMDTLEGGQTVRGHLSQSIISGWQSAACTGEHDHLMQMQRSLRFQHTSEFLHLLASCMQQELLRLWVSTSQQLDSV